MPVTYYPSPDDGWWNAEVAKLIPYCDGKGVDVGCGGRTIFPTITRVDVNPDNKPEIVCSGDKLPFADGEYDYFVSIHSFEHFDDQEAVLKEWLRVVRPDGFICLVHPDVDFTGVQKPVEENPKLKADPTYKHFHERNYHQMKSWLLSRLSYGFIIVESGPACKNWSFYFILKKT